MTDKLKRSRDEARRGREYRAMLDRQAHEALVKKAAKAIEDRQRSAYGYVTNPADRHLLEKLTDHELENIAEGNLPGTAY